MSVSAGAFPVFAIKENRNEIFMFDQSDLIRTAQLLATGLC